MACQGAERAWAAGGKTLGVSTGRMLGAALGVALLSGCYASHGRAPEGEGDAGVASSQYVYENACRAVYDYFLVDERPDRCLIAAFPDRFPPSAPSLEPARVVRGPAPCVEGGVEDPDFVEAEVEVDVEVWLDGDAYVARVAGRFPDGEEFDVAFRSADRRVCCDCWRSWP